MSYFTDYHEHVGTNLERFYKSTMFVSERMLLGMDCLEPGQQQPPHKHAGRDKFYFVIEGQGRFTIDQHSHEGGVGTVVWAPADSMHSVVNTGDVRLVMLIGMAPEPK